MGGKSIAIALFLFPTASAWAAHFALPAPSGWKQDQQGVAQTVWHSPDRPLATLAFQAFESDEVRARRAVEAPQYVEKLALIRSVLAAASAEHNWRVDHSRVEDFPGGFVLKLEGAFEDDSDIAHRFHEWHWFVGKSRAQASFVFDDRGADDALSREADSILGAMRREP